MKKRSFYRPTLIAAALLLAFAAATAQAQEHIIGQQVVSDTVIDASGVSYVGDMGVGEAGVAMDSSTGGFVGRSYGQPDLFYNYFTQGNVNSANAQMYLSPLPVPPNVGHTYFTYQPYYPHEMLYHHKNTFHRYYDNGRGMNRTRVKYYSPPVKQAVSNLYWNYLRIPR